MSKRVSKRIKRKIQEDNIPDNPDLLDERKFKLSRWQVEEKQALLEAIQAHGLADPVKLAKDVKTRNVAEIKHFVSNRRKVLCIEHKKIKDIDESEGTMVINQWCDKIREAVNMKFRGKNYSTVLEEIMNSAAESDDSPTECSDKEPNFSQLYSYLAGAMAGWIPPSLKPVESFLVLDAMQNLSETIKKELWSEETMLLKNLHLRPTIPLEKHLRLKSREDLWEIVRQEAEKGDQPNLETAPETNTVPTARLWGEQMLPDSHPVYKIQDHSHPYLLSSLNPLTIPTSFLEKEKKLIFET